MEEKICNRCIMDTTAPNIKFDNSGNCNFCNDLINGNQLNKNDIKHELDSLINRIKEDGKNKKYDCIVGVSGGVDSSYVLIKAIELGLRPLAVHMDNGWNSELAQNNIYNLISKLNIDLYTHVINWEEYRKLMQAFFDSDVVDVELLYDNAMLAVNYKLASKYKIKYILGGMNKSSEGMRMPEGWNSFKYDKKQIKYLAKKFSNISIKTFPAIGTLDYIFYRFFKKIQWTSILDLIDYKKDFALNILESNYSYKRYPYKHYESVFTRFYQGYILPKKFNIDKRKLHLSTLIANEQLTRDKAIEQMKKNAYVTELEQKKDIRYFLKKMRWNEKDLEEYLGRPKVDHESYPSEKNLWDSFLKINSFLK